MSHPPPGPPKPPTRRGPALGAIDGVRKDIEAMKKAMQAGEEYNPNGHGAAWTHDFLNKKPWHPMNFRNQAKVWEAEQQHYENERRNDLGRKEFEAEQHYLKTLSMLDPEEKEKYQQRQSVAWLYMKPPGFSEAAQLAEKKQQEECIDGADKNDQEQQQQQPLAAGNEPPQAAKRQRHDQGRGGNYLSKVVGGYRAVVQRTNLQLKGPLGGRSPPRGGEALDAPNQQYVVADCDSDQEEEAWRLAQMTEEERQKMRKAAAKRKRRASKEAEKQELEEAKAFLRAAGLTLPDDKNGNGGGSSGDSDDSSSSSSSDDDDSDSPSSDGEGEERPSSAVKGSGKKMKNSGIKEKKKGRRHKKKKKGKRRRKHNAETMT